MILERVFNWEVPSWMTVPSSMAVTLLFMILLVVRFAKDATPRSSLGEVFRKTLRKAVLVACSVIFASCCWTFYYAQYHGGKRAVDYIFATLLFVFLTCVGMSYTQRSENSKLFA